MIFREDKGTGYMYSYAPDHYCANKAGKVMEHVMVIADFIGRKLYSTECVHHIDRDRKNNSISNLILLTHEEHYELHAIEDKDTEYFQKPCEYCGESMTLTFASADRVNCSIQCATKASRKFEITAEDLSTLVWSMPTVKVAATLGISDVAVGKRCKRFGITKPPRGYWRKFETGTLVIN